MVLKRSEHFRVLLSNVWEREREREGVCVRVSRF